MGAPWIHSLKQSFDVARGTGPRDIDRLGRLHENVRLLEHELISGSHWDVSRGGDAAIGISSSVPVILVHVRITADVACLGLDGVSIGLEGNFTKVLVRHVCSNTQVGLKIKVVM